MQSLYINRKYNNLKLEELAEICNTTPYDILDRMIDHLVNPIDLSDEGITVKKYFLKTYATTKTYQALEQFFHLK